MKWFRNKSFVGLFLLVSVLIVFTPYLLTRSFGRVKFLEAEAHVGDTIGGTTAPIIGVISIFLLFLTLYEQRENNIKLLRLTYRQHFKDVYVGILNDYCSNRNSLTVKIKRCSGYQNIHSYDTSDYYDLFAEMTLEVRLIFDSLRINSFPYSVDYSLIEAEYENEKQHDSWLAIDDVESIPDMDERIRVKEIKSQYNERIKNAFNYDYYNISESEYNAFHKDENNISKQMLIVVKLLLKKYPQLKVYVKHVKQISTYSRISENEYVAEYQYETKDVKAFKNYYELLDELITSEERLLLFYISVTDLNFFNNLNHMGLFKKLDRKDIMCPELFMSYLNI